MRRKVLSACGALCALLGAVAFGFEGPASAQPYPPGPCTPTSSTGTAGSVAVGGTLTVTLDPPCVWTPGAGVGVAVNGTSVGTKTASASGTVSVNITALSTTQLSVDDPVLVPAVCGLNTVTARGPSTVAGTEVTHTESFTLVCPGAGVAQPQVRRGVGRVALTGANILRWSVIALGLVIVGGVFVAADRRKARAHD